MKTTTRKIDYTKKHWYIFELDDLVELRYGYGIKKDLKELVPSFGIAGYGNEYNNLKELTINNPGATNWNKVPGYVTALNAYNAVKSKALQKARLICETFNQNHLRP